MFVVAAEALACMQDVRHTSCGRDVSVDCTSNGHVLAKIRHLCTRRCVVIVSIPDASLHLSV